MTDSQHSTEVGLKSRLIDGGPKSPPIEVEQKYPLLDRESVVGRIHEIGAKSLGTETNEDHYFNHPAKDFGETREALRVRLINGKASITYKGPKMPGAIKARQEMEWSLGAEDSDGVKMRMLLTTLDFRPVAVVRKIRESFESVANGLPIYIVIDQVEGLGEFAEIEMICQDASGVESARTAIAELAQRIGLADPEPRSYLTMLLEKS